MIFVVALAISGLFLVFLEFFLPGAVMAIGGILLLLSSVLAFQMEGASGFELIGFIFGLSILVFLTIRLAVFVLQSIKNKGTIILQSDQEGFQASSVPVEVINSIGLADTDLGPSGYIIVNKQRFCAVSQDGYLDKGTCVKVLGISGSSLIVELNRSDE